MLGATVLFFCPFFAMQPPSRQGEKKTNPLLVLGVDVNYLSAKGAVAWIGAAVLFPPFHKSILLFITHLLLELPPLSVPPVAFLLSPAPSALTSLFFTVLMLCACLTFSPHLLPSFSPPAY